MVLFILDSLKFLLDQLASNLAVILDPLNCHVPDLTQFTDFLVENLPQILDFLESVLLFNLLHL